MIIDRRVSSTVSRRSQQTRELFRRTEKQSTSVSLVDVSSIHRKCIQNSDNELSTVTVTQMKWFSKHSDDNKPVTAPPTVSTTKPTTTIDTHAEDEALNESFTYPPKNQTVLTKTMNLPAQEARQCKKDDSGFMEDVTVSSPVASRSTKNLNDTDIKCSIPRSEAINDFKAFVIAEEENSKHSSPSAKKKWWNPFNNSKQSSKSKSSLPQTLFDADAHMPSDPIDEPMQEHIGVGVSWGKLQQIVEDDEEPSRIVDIDSLTEAAPKKATHHSGDPHVSKLGEFMKSLHISRTKKTPSSASIEEPSTSIQTPCRNPKVMKRAPSKSEDESKAYRRAEILKVIRKEYTAPQDFNANYELLDLLGDGAFGFVFLARILNPTDPNITEAAVKFIIRDKVATDGWAHDPTHGYIPFECHFMTRIQHPNIIRFLDLYQDERFIYMVTEFHGVEWTPTNPILNPVDNVGIRPCIEKISAPPHVMQLSSLQLSRMTDSQLLQRKRTACDLFECIDAHKKIPEKVAKMITIQIVDSLEYLQSIGFVHRDLKDENVVIDNKYNVKLIDFGSCSRIPAEGDTEQYFDRFNGTLHFAAPEILQGQFYRGPEADVWALGVLLYTIIFGENPFPNPEDVVRRNIKFPEEPRGAVSLMGQMLMNDPTQRYTLAQVKSDPWLQDAVNPLL